MIRLTIELLTFFLLTTPLKAQDYIKSGNIYLNVNGRNFRFDAIKLNSLTTMFGKPVKTKIEVREMSDVNANVFVYPYGNIDFERAVLTDINIKKPGWGFAFNIKNKMTPVFSVGSDESLLNKTFPESALQKGKDGIQVWLKNNDSYLFFETKNGKITAISYTVDES